MFRFKNLNPRGRKNTITWSKKFLLIISLFMFLIIGRYTLYATEITGTTPDGYWEYTYDTLLGYVTIDEYIGQTISEITVPNTIVVNTGIGLPASKAVKVMGREVFYNRLTPEDIISITMGSNMKTIETNAFRGCSGLTNVTALNVTTIEGDGTFYADYGAFANCLSLQTINMPNVVSIGQYAFHNCTSLENIEMQQATTIKKDAFCFCTSLQTINMPNVVSIGRNAFYNCSQLTTVDFPEVESIEDHAFYNCNQLTTVDFPKVESIEDHAFYNCNQLTTVDFPKVESIEDYAFYNCEALNSFTIYDTVRAINSYAFANTGITSLQLPQEKLYWEKKPLGETEWVEYKESYFPIQLGTTALRSTLILEGTLNITGTVKYNSTLFADITGTNIPDNAIVTYKWYRKESLSGEETLLQSGEDNSYKIVQADIGYKILLKVHTDKTMGTLEVNTGSVEKLSGIDDPDWINSPQLQEKTFYSITLIPMDGYQYAVVTEGTLPLEVDWQDSNVFYDLIADNEYSAYLRIKETDTKYASVASYSLFVMTEQAPHTYEQFTISFDANGANGIPPNNIIQTEGTSSEVPSKSLLSYFDKVFYCWNSESDGSGTDYYEDDKIYVTKDTVLYAKWVDASSTNDFIYDGNTITGYIGEGGIVVIPEVNGSITIGQEAFKNNQNITHIIIPNTNFTMNDSAFAYSLIERVTIGSTSNIILNGRNFFSYCENLKYVDLSNTDYVHIINDQRYIAKMLFYNCCSLETVKLPTNLNSFNTQQIYYSQGMYSKNFVGCYSLKEIIIENDYFKSQDGVLFNGDMTELLYYPSGKKDSVYTIPNTVTTIKNDAFYGAHNITDVIIPVSVTNIEENAFNNSSLTSVTLPTQPPWKEWRNEIGSPVDLVITDFETNYYVYDSQPPFEGSDTLSGIPKVGETMTANVEITSLESPAEALTYQWQKKVGLSTYSNISGATESSLTITSSDLVGAQIRVIVESITETGVLESELSATIEKGDVTEEVLTPNVASRTDTSVTLVVVPGYEYRIDGGIYQDSVSFTGLIPNTQYTFYQRIKETDTYNASAESNGVTISTEYSSLEGEVAINDDGSPQFGETLSVNTSGITNNTGELYYQWTREGIDINGATDATYTLVEADIGTHIRVEVSSDAETGTILSNATIAVTKADREAPAAPAVAENGVSATSVMLVYNYQYEYSKDGINWTTTALFSSLSPNTTYQFYQRYIATSTYNASSASEALNVTTLHSNLTGDVILSFDGVSLDFGETVTAVVNNTNNSGTLSYQWLRIDLENNLETQIGENTQTYTTTAGDVGMVIKVEISSSVELGNIRNTSNYIVNKANFSGTVESLTFDEVTHNSVIITPHIGYEYRQGLNGNWQDSNVFIDLQPKTNYVFYQRVKETATHIYSLEESNSVNTTEEPVNGSGTISGYVKWKSSGNDGITVNVYANTDTNYQTRLYTSTTDADGHFSIDVDEGTYRVEFVFPRCLKTRYYDVAVTVNVSTILSTADAMIQLLVGDVDGDGNINSSDKGILTNSLNYNKNSIQADNALCDLDADGNINSADKGILTNSINYNKGNQEIQFQE